MGEIIWARRDPDGIYWPAKINFISNNSTETASTRNSVYQYRICSYRVLFLGSNQTQWIADVLPYRQYREYMSKTLLIHYEAYPEIKYQFLNAMSQADYVNSDENPNKFTNSSSFKSDLDVNYTPTSNSIVPGRVRSFHISDCLDNHLADRNMNSLTTNEYSFNHYSQSSNLYSQYMSNSPYGTQLSSNNYCSCCLPPSFSSIDPFSTNTNFIPSSQFPDEYRSVSNGAVSLQTETYEKINSIIIITTKTYSNSSFISYLFNCFSHFPHHSIIYIDDPIINYQHPTTSNISYLICLDHFDSTIKQALNSTVFNNLTTHITYLFLLLNAPSHELVKHFYSTVMDQRTIVVLHYHSTFENEALLLCSGSRTTYEMIRCTLLKYLCSKIKFIESEGNGEEQFYSTNDIPLRYQSNNIKSEPMIDIPNQTLVTNSFIDYPIIPTDYLAVTSIKKKSKKSSRSKHMKPLERRTLKRKLKKRVSTTGISSASSSQYHVQNILDTFNFLG